MSLDTVEITDSDTSECIREVFEGTYDECVTFLRKNKRRHQELLKQGMRFDIVCGETGRLRSWVLS